MTATIDDTEGLAGDPLFARTTWDAAADAGYIQVSASWNLPSAHQCVVVNPVAGMPDVVLDFDAHGRLLGVEVMGSAALVQPADR